MLCKELNYIFRRRLNKLRKEWEAGEWRQWLWAVLSSFLVKGAEENVIARGV